MRISTQDIPVIMAEYADSQIAPKASGVQKFGTYALLFIIKNKMNEIAERYAPTMRMTGIMDDEGMIDVEYLYNLASDAMSHAGKVNVLGYNMDGSDIESLYAIAARHGR